MDPITHLLTGACLGRAGLNRTTTLATVTLTLAADAPDIDVVAYFGGSVSGLEHHRGITHTLLAAPFVAALTVGAVWAIHRLLKNRRGAGKAPPNWKLLYLYALLAVLVHIFQDFTNNYGVRPFTPFNPKWYSWDIVFIIDPIMLIALVLGLVTPGIFALISEEVGAAKSQFRGRGGAVFALVCLSLLILVRDYEHRRAVTALKSITYRDEDALRVSAFPNPLNLLSWNGVVETRDFFELLPVDSNSGEVDPHNLAVMRYKPEETPVTLAAKKSRLGRVYLDWAQYPLVETERLPQGKGYRVRFSDLRFANIAGLNKRRSIPLTAYVELDSQLQVRAMHVGAPPEWTS